MLPNRIMAALAFVLAVQTATREEFVWQYAGHTIGRLRVPTGFAIGTYNYKEGIVTTLRFSDRAIR